MKTFLQASFGMLFAAAGAAAGLDDTLTPNSDFYGSMEYLLARGKADGVDIRLPRVWTRSDPFGGL